MYKISNLLIAIACSLLLAIPNVASANTQGNLKALLGKLMDLEHTLAKRPKVEDEDNILAPGSRYTIQSGDSLALIADTAYGDTDVRLDLIREMIVDANPHAFFRDNPNFIYAEKVISIPSVDDLRNFIFKDTKARVFKSQSKAHWIRFP